MVINDKIKWHMDTSSKAPLRQYDLSTTVLHELRHSPLFSGTIKANAKTRTAEYTDDRAGRFDTLMKGAGRIGAAKMCKDESFLFNAITNPSLRFVDDRSGASYGLYSPPWYVSGSSTPPEKVSPNMTIRLCIYSPLLMRFAIKIQPRNMLLFSRATKKTAQLYRLQRVYGELTGSISPTRKGQRVLQSTS